MVYQLRQYHIHTGQMGQWLELFHEHIKPLHERLGIPIIGAWQSSDQASFIWIRAFDNASVISSTEAAYFAAPERKALGDLPQKLIASMTITVMTDDLQNDPPS